jgi:predicted lipoprotein
MKKQMKFFMLGIGAAALSLGMASCNKSGDDPQPDLSGTDAEYQAVLNSFVESTAVPTYKQLAEAALRMRTANQALKAYPSDTHMKLASDAWMDARIKWEISEAFLFGPVGDEAMQIAGHIDSWPLELEDIKTEIAMGTLTGLDAWGKEPEVIGFHVTEYLLYRDGKSRPVADLTPNELSYLTAATDALVWDCVLAYVAWVGYDNVPQEMQEIFNENPAVKTHLANNPSYNNFASRMKNATGYPSLADAMLEIASGVETIAEEVGVTKISDPYDQQNTLIVESWYSWHSLDDYANNILSIENAYLGGLNDATRPAVSLSTYIASKDAALDARIKAQITDCIAKIRAMGGGQYSFYEVVRDQLNKTQVDAAVQACLDLADTFKDLSNNIN